MSGEAGVEVGFSFAQSFEAVTVAADAVLEEVGRQPSVFEAFEVALQLAFDAHGLRTRRCDLLSSSKPLAFGHVRELGECLLDDLAAAVQLGELGEDGGFEPVFGSRSPLRLAGFLLAAVEQA